MLKYKNIYIIKKLKDGIINFIIYSKNFWKNISYYSLLKLTQFIKIKSFKKLFINQILDYYIINIIKNKVYYITIY